MSPGSPISSCVIGRVAFGAPVWKIMSPEVQQSTSGANLPEPKTILIVLLALIAAAFLAFWLRELLHRPDWRRPRGFPVLVGFITSFFDTLGIGSFATTTTLFRLRKEVADEKIPGTLNVGHTMATITETFIYITIIEVETATLVLLIGASVLGAWFGAGVVSRMPRRRIQIGMGMALFVAALLMLRGMLDVMSGSGTALGLHGDRLLIAIAGNLVIGALMTIGIGAYAPIMIMVSLLGMNPKAAYPIMMGSCAFLMPIASVRFIRTGAYDAGAALGLTLGGIPAVLIAGLIVKQLPLDVVRWLVVVVVLYAGASLLRAARAERRQAGGEPRVEEISP
jgi:uncharacterized membrane protein YfcA